jgi:phospholipase C
MGTPEVGKELIFTPESPCLTARNFIMKPTRIHRPTITQARARNLTRRDFIRTATGAAAGLALTQFIPNAEAARRNKNLPTPNRSGIEHIIVVMMENRSFDHFLGWVPGADGQQEGLIYYDEAGVAHPTQPLAPNYQGCGLADPDHSYAGGRIEYNNGACDGWLLAGENDDYAIGYYTAADLPFYAGAAANWTTFDRYFTSIMAGTFPNRFYQHCAQTDRLENSLTFSSLPTIWDRLAEHSVSARYYYSDIPFTALWGTKYLSISRHITEFLADCAAGTLPRVSFVEPRFVGAALGLTNDDHPHADIRNGQAFLDMVYQAVTTSPNWGQTVMVVNYDEWGGFFDHVAPPFAAIPPADRAVGSDGLMGFRVPAFVISPFARRGTVNHTLYDHTSVLKMIEWRWNLRPLTIRDKNANNLAESLDLSQRNLSAPVLGVPPGPFGELCGGIPVPDKFDFLATIASNLGFPLFD